MIKTGFETRVKIQQIVDNQLPEFILDESPKAVEFLKQYYISQEFQSATIDIAENLDQYLKLENLTPEVITGFTNLSINISPFTEIIVVNSTKGFPSKYGLFKIDDEIITYTGITTNSFTGCIRGFSGVTDYHNDLKADELVFSQSTASSHLSGSEVKNLSSLFLQEFYKKLKYSLTPGLENLNFVSNLNIGNFIKEARSLYESKGTSESFRILFNVLYGENPTVIDLEKFLTKSSSSEYIRREVIVIEPIFGNPVLLEGQSIFKSTDIKTSASVSEIETITRFGKTFYKLFLFLGYDDTYPTITGTFNITPSTKNLDKVSIGSSVVNVDSTIGFANSGKIYFENNEISYTDKSVNQFFGCSEINVEIPIGSVIRSNETYYGYEDGDMSRKVEFRITGVLSNLDIKNESFNFVEGDKIIPLNIGEKIENPDLNKTIKQIFANTWIYNTSTRHQIESFSGSNIILKSKVDKSNIKSGDTIEVLYRNTDEVVSGYENVLVNLVNDEESNEFIKNRILTTNTSFSSFTTTNFDIRRKIKKANSSIVPFEFGNNSIISDVLNVYDENSEYLYVASNSLPSYQINSNIFRYNIAKLDASSYNPETEKYSILEFDSEVSFITGDKIYYDYTNFSINGLERGNYFVEVLTGNKKIKLYTSSPTIGSSSFVLFGDYSGSLPSGTHTITLFSQRTNKVSPQKILKKFKINPNIGNNKSDYTIPGPIGMLKNGVEIYSYKTNDKIYYGPLESVDVLNGGTEYDVINLPYVKISSGNALLQPVVSGSVEKIYIDPQDFNIDKVVSINLTGGNGSGAVFSPIIEKNRRELEFDARSLENGGQLDYVNETISFSSPHNLINGQQLIYRNNNSPEIGIGSFKGSNFNQNQYLKSGSSYFVKLINERTIQLYQSFSDYNSGINTVGFTTIGNVGIQKFETEVKNIISGIKVINGGSGYTNRLLRINSSGISTFNHTFNFDNHGFNDGELVVYSYQSDGISGLSTSNQYYVLKVDSNSFRLCDAGVGGTNTSNYERKNYVKFTNKGSGYQTFNYPKISLDLKYTLVGLGSTQVYNNITATPIVRGKISQVYVYDKGSNYGSTILNVHQRPPIIVKTGSDAQFLPIISNGKIIDVKVQYGGIDYYSTPDLIVSGEGTGALLRPVIVNNKIVDVVVINSGIGYSENTTVIKTKSAGKNAVFQSNVRDLTLNNSYKYGIQNEFFRNPSSEIFAETNNNLQYSIIGYSQYVKENIGDNGFIQLNQSGNVVGSRHSPIIGWAYDGNPIYGPYGYSNPNDVNSPIKELKSSYIEVSILNRPSTNTFPLKFFVEDFEYNNSGDLDEYNGRFTKTPEFPNGVYAYFATIETNNQGQIVGKFPYFIGNKYRSNILEENLFLNQSFDFNNSSLIRNTLPYKVNELFSNYDFVIEPNKIINQKSVIESVTSGSVTDLKIINSGSNYSIGDELLFDDTNTGGGGISVKVSELKGKDIVDIKTSTLNYLNSSIEWVNGQQVKVNIEPYHELFDKDNIIISGLTTQSNELNGFYQIGVTSSIAGVANTIPNYSTTGIVTDIYLTNIPNNISVGSSIKINNETFSVLNVYSNFGILRVSRSSTGTSHTISSPVYFLPDSFVINKKINYFDSKKNIKTYFNPTQSIGIGTVSGSGIYKNYNIGITTYNVFIPTQSIFIPNHPFTNAEEVILRKINGNSISVSNFSSGESSFSLLSENSEKVYIIKKSRDFIGIVTNIGLTTTSNGVFFLSSGSDNYFYSIETKYNQIFANVSRVNGIISLSTSHNLKYNDVVSLKIEPNISVGIGTSISVDVRIDNATQNLVINPLTFSSSGINTSLSSITIPSHNLQNGSKVVYKSTGIVASGLNTGIYYVYKIDNDRISLCETFKDSLNDPPLTVSIASTGSGTHSVSLINPQIPVIKNNNLKFNLSDSSLQGYKFKIYYDENFTKEFISDGNENNFSIYSTGIVGISSTASLTIDFSSKSPEKLYYSLEKSGYISTSDKEVINHSQILLTDSQYNGNYYINGVGSTTFAISLKSIPEKSSYTQNECDVLEYTTKSKTEVGGVSKLTILSGGVSYKKLPLFKGSNSINGLGLFVLPISNEIGKIKEERIVNGGFEYSSDKTLRPTASIPKSLSIFSANTINSISIINGGKDYISPPNLVCVDTDTGELINSGFIRCNLFGSTINSVVIENYPKGLPSKPITIKAINNSNGISINQVQYSSSGIVTCILVTPTLGFTTPPFSSQDKIFVEGIQKINSNGDGFNSSDHGYNFFTITNYFSGIPSKLEYDISKYTNNPGTPKDLQESYANIINFSSYPEFKVTQTFSPFLVGEKLFTNNGNGFIERDLIVINSDVNFVRVSGTYNLSSNEKIRGIESFSEATVSNQNSIEGKYNIDYSNKQNLGWKTNTGKLNEIFQVIPDNDYYQNLSYSVKSKKTWEEIVTPVNNILHPSGLKNFADLQIEKSVTSGVETSKTNISITNNYISENRLDTINNFDLVLDVDTFEDKSKFLEFNTIKLSDYVLCKTNRVLEVDDISSLFSSNEDERSSTSNIFTINPSNQYNRFLIQTRNIDNNKIQFDEIITINDDNEIYTLKKGFVFSETTDYFSFNSNDNLLAEIEGNVSEENIFYIKFDPSDPYDSNFDIKVLQNTISNSTGISSFKRVGCVDLINENKDVETGITTSLISIDASKYSSLYTNAVVFDSNGSKINYIEIYLTHDGANSYMSEYYFDDTVGNSFGFIGSFGSSISNGILSLNYTNTSNNAIRIRSKSVGFGSTSLGKDTYRFIIPGQIPGNERSLLYKSDYTNVSSASTDILVLDKNLFSSVKSTVKVSIGNTSALHQIISIHDGTNSHLLQYPFLSIGSTTGIGTFSSEIINNDFKLKFNPDFSSNENIEIISFNESFYQQLDLLNTPPTLEYGAVSESVTVSNYFGLNTPFGERFDFQLKYNNIPIFSKKFNPSNTSIVELSSGKFTIPNHFFSTGEELIYTPNSTFTGVASSAMGIGSTENYLGITTNLLPNKLWAIKDNNNQFRVATKPEYASQGIGVTFISIGSGNSHEIEMYKKNEKSLITINNLVQYPISYTLINHTLSNNGGEISGISTIFALSGISSISLTDILKIDDEYMKVENVGFGTTSSGKITYSGNVPLVEVKRGVLGTKVGVHTDTSIVRVYRGFYNIVGDRIFFTESPKGSLLDIIQPQSSNLPRQRDTFTGRIFLRKNYETNKIYDDISEKFTGTDQIFSLTTQGITTTGIGTSGGNGIVFINNIFQTPTTLNNSNNNYFISENSGIGSIVFTGITSTNGNIYKSDFDINQNQLPRGGLIVSLGSTPGLGYAPLVGASVTAVVGAGGSIVSIGIGTNFGSFGSGYRNPVSIAITEISHTGIAATIQAIVGAGGTLSFEILSGGTGYANPIVNISSPNYENLSVIGVSRLGIGYTTHTGSGLLLNVEVGASSTSVGIGSTLFEVTSFKITRPGYGFRRGDVFTPVGLVTAKGFDSPPEKFEITVLETFNDSFGAWQFGELDYIDSIKLYQDGSRKRFPLYYNGKLLSFEIDEDDSDSQLIDFSSLLVIFINGVLQKSGESYDFNGGTSFTFSTAPKSTDNISIFFYRGTRGEDTEEVTNIQESIKIGDTLQVFSNNNFIDVTTSQNSRIVYDIAGSDRVETNLYGNQGIDILNKKPVYWTKQKSDLIINGQYISKSRESLEPQIYPTANLIKSITEISTEIFVDSIDLFNYENANPVKFDAFIVSSATSQYELVKNISTIEGFNSSIVGIATTTGIGVPLALRFQIVPSPASLLNGYPIYVSNTNVGNGVTSINTANNDIVSISTSFLDNIYYVSSYNPSTGILTCNIHSETSIVGIATTGTIEYSVGKLSWGKMTGFSRSSNPISIGISGYTSSVGITSLGYNSGLSTYPIIQRRGTGFRGTGSLSMKLSS